MRYRSDGLFSTQGLSIT